MESTLEISLIDAEPLSTEFTSLADHAASTPASYSLDTDPILYYEINNAVLRILGSGFPAPPTHNTNGSFNGGSNNGNGENEETRTVNIKIASSRVYMWFPELGYGYSIPYQSITMHGLSKGPVIYFQFGLGSGSETGFVEAYLEPPAVVDAIANGNSGASSAEVLDQTFREIYNALSACANLHASPLSSDEDEADGIALDMDIDLDLPVPGAAAGGDDDGWTTSTNHHQDNSGADSNGKAGLEVTIDRQDVAVLSGVRRRRDEDDEDEAADPETEKWRRTS
ncbi:hypothetical protein DV452_000670 [Geotrichum candidum]|nr:hypothetical protein DV452_000670 [Geotrichum candidum]KAI8132756.1 hypothetical protein DUD61_003588 [Geotrichum candidum]KAI9213064.1 hypothetical protein DS838_002061 [Geotrichum bryndzae]